MALTIPLDHIDPTASPLTYNLGEHTLIISADGAIELADTQVVMQLNPDEVYKLLVTLQTMFT